MKKKEPVHYYRPGTEPSQEPYGKGWTLCTNYVYSSRITSSPKKATCGLCKRSLKALSRFVRL